MRNAETARPQIAPCTTGPLSLPIATPVRRFRPLLAVVLGVIGVSCSSESTGAGGSGTGASQGSGGRTGGDAATTGSQTGNRGDLPGTDTTGGGAGGTATAGGTAGMAASGDTTHPGGAGGTAGRGAAGRSDGPSGSAGNGRRDAGPTEADAGSRGGGTSGGGGSPSGTAGNTNRGTGGASGPITGDWPPSATFSNPVMWEDLPDPEVIRVDDVFYYTASNMHYSPGAPILRSWDLVNWDYVGHAVPVLDFGSKYNLSNGRAYINGTWASSLHYRKSNKKFYWIGCIDFGKTYVYSATAAEGPWERAGVINNCYYDCGMMVDYDESTDDTMYVAFGGSGNISVAQLGPDYTTQTKSQQVYTTGGSYSLEGSHFFKYKNNYYITPTRPANGEFVLRSSSPFGTYTSKNIIDNNSGPIAGAGTPHQGSFIQTAKGDWYYMAFQDAYPGGRIPVLAPVTWSDDGWPSVQLSGKAWAASYPYPDVPKPPQAPKPHTGLETFAGQSLPADWEWNHNPDDTKWSIDDGVTLKTATVTDDLFAARNTLTHRNIGPQSTATVELDISGMSDGDISGLSLFRHVAAYVGVKKSGGSAKVAMVSGLTMNTSNWATTSKGTEADSKAFSGNTIWLRASLDVRPSGGTKQGKFAYSTDGTTFTAIGSNFALNTDWQFYPGYRFGIFNFATTALGGVVKVKSFNLTTL